MDFSKSGFSAQERWSRAWYSRPNSENFWLVPFVLALGLVLRLVWIFISPTQGAREASNVATAFAKTGQFADAYFVGSGPTAHLMPSTPMVGAFVFEGFGVFSPISNSILAGWCLFQVLLSFGLLSVLFRRLGASPITRLVALAFLSLVPVYLGQETFDFRFWEGALATSLGCATLIVLVSHDGAEVAWRQIATVGILAALTFFVSPALGLGIYAAVGIFILQNLSGIRRWGALIFIISIIAAVLAPWLVRNIVVLHSPIILRDNLPLEMHMANVDVPISSSDPLSDFVQKLQSIHPVFQDGRERMEKAGGEIAYEKVLSREVDQWIWENPQKFVRLSIRHFGQFFFPRPWQFKPSGMGKFSLVRSLIISTVSLLGLVGLALGLWRRRRGFQYLAVTILLTALPYSVVQPIPRYTYVVYGLLVFLTADLIARFGFRLKRWPRESLS